MAGITHVRAPSAVLAGGGILLGFLVAFILSGVVTEPWEGSLDFPALPVAKTAAIIVASAASAYAAWRRTASLDGPFWTAVAGATPAWFALEGNLQAVVGIGLALGLSWAGIALEQLTLRAALLLVSAFAWFMTPSPTLQLWALGSTLLLGAAAFAPIKMRKVAAPLGATAWVILVTVFAWGDAVEQADRGDLRVLVLGMAALVAVAVAAIFVATRLRRGPLLA